MKNIYIVFLLFVMALVGISSLTFVPKYFPEERRLLLRETKVSTADLMKEKRYEKMVTHTAASFYFQQ